MSKLTITDDQEAAIDAIRPLLEQAFAEGVQDGAANPVLDAMQLYGTLTEPVKQDVKDPFEALAAAMMLALNIRRVLPTGQSATVALAKLTPGGSNGSLTFVDGLLVSKVDPT